MPMRRPSVCAVCQRAGCAVHGRKPKDERPSAYRRGYDAAWRRLRLRTLDERPLCEHCQTRGRITPAEHVHHEKPVRTHPELRLEPSNLTPLCVPCHNAIRD
jgi:5-methylcytosine-specific restriction enzyme A